jgi:tetratricopeptide (TPR) repeat protein
MTVQSDKSATAVTTKPVDKVVVGMMLTAAAIAILSLGVIATRMMKRPLAEPAEVLRLASNQYLAGNRVVAGELASSVELEFEEPETPPVDHKAPPPVANELKAKELAEKRQQYEKWKNLQQFLISAGILARIDTAKDDRQRRNMQREAVDLLRRVEKVGFPDGRDTEGNRLLGKTLFDLGEYGEAQLPLETALRLDPTLLRELMPVYAMCLRRANPARPADALDVINEYLADPASQKSDLFLGLGIRIELLVDLGKWDEAKTDIEAAQKIEWPTNPEDRNALSQLQDKASLMKGAMVVRQLADEIAAQSDDPSAPAKREISDSAMAETIEYLESVQRRSPPEVSSQAHLWSARARMLVGDVDGALVDFTLVRQQRPFSGVSIVAGLEEVELLADKNRGVEVVQTVRYMMREIGGEDGFDSTSVTLVEFINRINTAIDRLRSQGSYSESIEVARALPPLMPKADALIQEGLGYAAWAEATQQQTAKNKVDRETAKLARTRFRTAGESFQAASELLFGTPQYVPTQWSAIEAFQNGRYFTHSIELLRPYLRYEDYPQQSRGLLAMGRALMAEGKAEEAMDYLEQCMVEHPRDPLIYDARLAAAQSLAELEREDEALDLLKQTLQDGSLSPKSPVRRDSLFEFGAILYRKGSQLHHRFEKNARAITPKQAIENTRILTEGVLALNECVKRNWPSDQALIASYWVARSKRMLADNALIEASSPDILEAARRGLVSNAEGHLQASLESLNSLSEHLLAQEDESRLSEAERRMLRNCMLERGDVLEQLGRSDDAINAYRTAELRYANTPIALEAIMRRSELIRRNGKRDEADRLIQQAESVLQRIPTDYDSQFASITRYDRQRWKQYLEWMSRKINFDNSAS